MCSPSYEVFYLFPKGLSARERARLRRLAKKRPADGGAAAAKGSRQKEERVQGGLTGGSRCEGAKAAVTESGGPRKLAWLAADKLSQGVQG